MINRISFRFRQCLGLQLRFDFDWTAIRRRDVHSTIYIAYLRDIPVCCCAAPRPK